MLFAFNKFIHFSNVFTHILFQISPSHQTTTYQPWRIVIVPIDLHCIKSYKTILEHEFKHHTSATIT